MRTTEIYNKINEMKRNGQPIEGTEEYKALLALPRGIAWPFRSLINLNKCEIFIGDIETDCLEVLRKKYAFIKTDEDVDQFGNMIRHIINYKPFLEVELDK